MIQPDEQTLFALRQVRDNKFFMDWIEKSIKYHSQQACYLKNVERDWLSGRVQELFDLQNYLLGVEDAISAKRK